MTLWKAALAIAEWNWYGSDSAALLGEGILPANPKERRYSASISSSATVAQQILGFGIVMLGVRNCFRAAWLPARQRSLFLGLLGERGESC